MIRSRTFGGRFVLSALVMLASFSWEVALASGAPGNEPATRWKIASDGGIAWDIAPTDTHRDFIEMSGEQVAVLVRYGLNQNAEFTVNHEVVWPLLRFFPQLTGNHLRMSFGEDAHFDADYRFNQGFLPSMRVQVKDAWWPLSQRELKRVHHKGITRFEGVFRSWDEEPKLSFRRDIFPSVDKPAVIDTTVMTNVSPDDVELSVDEFHQSMKTGSESGVYGAYKVTKRVVGAGVRTLRPGDSTTVTVLFEAHKDGESLLSLDIPEEQQARVNRVGEILAKMQLQTPDAVLNTTFAFAKIRTAESIFRTKAGLMHAPGGGGGYYAAIWANDQAEYANPFFGMLGDPVAIESAINSFRHFARFMNPEYRPIPSSIIAEGDNVWHGAGDRGDMTMIAYGAARFALAYGARQTAQELWPLIEWCLEYSRRKLNSQGVVVSDSDELEGRFPAGNANLSTSSLYYDALRSAAMLGAELGKPRNQVEDYAARAAAARAAIERYFGATVEGFETYRYYDKADLEQPSEIAQRIIPKEKLVAYATRPDVLRAWIAIPLTMDIFDRQAGTIDALFSPHLWKEDGLLTEAGQTTYWDRSTLYALRGVLAAGDLKRGMERLKFYSERRLLGEHVPYPFEAHPEGGKAQLAAESALYCRVFTEGLFGLRPTGLRAFTVTPRLPEGWPSMALRKVHAFGHVFDLEVTRAGRERLKVKIVQAGSPKKSYVLRAGATASVNLQ